MQHDVVVAAMYHFARFRASSQPLVGQHADLGIDMAPHMPTNPENQKNFLVNNIEWWSDNQDDVEAKFQSWLVK